MPERDIHALRAAVLATLAEATQAANSAPDLESALRYLTAATQEVLGDKEAHLRPGGLRAGERQFTAADRHQIAYWLAAPPNAVFGFAAGADILIANLYLKG